MHRRLGEAGGGTGVAVRAAQYQKNDGSVRLCSTYYNHPIIFVNVMYFLVVDVAWLGKGHFLLRFWTQFTTQILYWSVHVLTLYALT